MQAYCLIGSRPESQAPSRSFRSTTRRLSAALYASSMTASRKRHFFLKVLPVRRAHGSSTSGPYGATGVPTSRSIMPRGARRRVGRMPHEPLGDCSPRLGGQPFEPRSRRTLFGVSGGRFLRRPVRAGVDLTAGACRVTRPPRTLCAAIVPSSAVRMSQWPPPNQSNDGDPLFAGAAISSSSIRNYRGVPARDRRRTARRSRRQDTSHSPGT